MSILLAPGIPPTKANLLTTCAAVCLSRAIEEAFGVKADIKWVNDIYYKGRKIAGILTEGKVNMESGLLDYAIVGVGINIFPPKGGFPADIADKAGAILEGEAHLERETLAACFVNLFYKHCRCLDSMELFSDYRDRMFLVGREVEVVLHCGEETKKARVVGLGEDYSLRVQYTDGEIANLYDGEVSLVLNKSNN